MKKFTETEKWCNRCKTWKTKEQFNRSSAEASGFSTYCRDCISDYNAAYNPAYREKNKDKVFLQKENSRIFRVYGLTPEQYKKMWDNQGGICAMAECQRPIQCVDHDHETNVTRMLLCKACNAALGIFGDDPDRLRKAAEYIEKFRRG